MLSRYLGNKTDLLDPILEQVAANTPVGGTVGDLFAGSMAVSAALKYAGYNVIANDINDFSSAYGRAFIVNNHIPELPAKLIPKAARRKCDRLAAKRMDALKSQEGYKFLSDQAHAEAYQPVAALIEYLNSATVEDLPEEHRRTHFFDTYTEEGKNSAFESQRGTIGRRRFFSSDNGRRLDIVLNMLRWWSTEYNIAPELLALCTSITCRAAEKVANNQGTWHDFPRDWIDSRALQQMSLTPPPFDVALTGGLHIIGDAEDSLEFARRMPPMDTLYLDPPYNFRQYTAYYFLPNMIARYPILKDPDDWFSKIEFVRGQNMSNNFDSTFCKKSRFIPSLRSLIERAKTNTVILSYFNGRNHWNDFKTDTNDIGLNFLTDFFKSELFERDSLRIFPVPRTNYQSYRGHLARSVDEYLFVVRKNNALA